MEELAIEVVKSISSLVAAQAWDEISFAWGFQDHLAKLKQKFICIQIFLKDMGEATHPQTSHLVKHWLQRVKDATFFADDVMGDYTYEILRRKIELDKNLSCKKKMRNFFSRANNPIVFRFRMTHKVREVLSMFDELDEEAQKIGPKLAMKAVASSSINSHDDELDQIRKHADARGSEFIGRDEDEKKLVEMLCNPENMNRELSIIAIVGIGGLGKTTLARRLYEHEKVKVHFAKKKAWVCVSEDFNTDRIYKEMAESFSQNHCNIEELKGEKFLLVLDDVWNTNLELWNTLKNLLLQRIGRINEGVILITTRSTDVVEKAGGITTRSTDVAEKAGVVHLHKLEGLSDEESWALLKQKAFPSGALPHVSSFEEVGRRIAVRKCKGVPLAIKAVGGVLRRMKHPSEWESIEGNELWNLPEDDKNYVLPSLLLSYNHLPGLSLKQCFAYCAIFPKDRIIMKRELIALWIAQDFLDKVESNNSTLELEEQGRKYFKILVNNSFLQEEKTTKEFFTRDFDTFKMHDLVHDLALHISQKDVFVWKVGAKLDTTFNHRHLAIDCGEGDRVTEIPMVGQNLRTINIWSIHRLPYLLSMLMRARYLRTLIMVNTGITEVPSSIGQLKHLRYLDVSDNPIETLPESICRLYQLQTLRSFGDDWPCKLFPRNLHWLVSLKQLVLQSGSDYDLLQLPALGQLPNLVDLWLKGFGVERIGEEFFYISTSNDGDTSNSPIGGNVPSTVIFPALRHLLIEDFEGLKTLIFPPAATAFPCLETLYISNCKRLEVVETSPTLTFKSLKHVHLEDIAGTQPLDIIKYHTGGSLTSLKVSSMFEMTHLPQELLNFTKLESLQIEECWCLISIPEDMFPNLALSLRHLVINSCYRLRRIPKGLEECTSLEILTLTYFRSLEYIPHFHFSAILHLRKLRYLTELTILNSLKTLAASVLECIPHLHHLQKVEVQLFPDQENENSCFSNDDITPPFNNQSLSLVHLTINGDLKSFKCLPHKLLQLHLPCLQSLHLSYFIGLEILPEWVGTLSSLQELNLWYSDDLKFLPSTKAMQSLTQLRSLVVERCRFLEEKLCPKYNNEPDSEWHKISHIPNIMISSRDPRR